MPDTKIAYNVMICCKWHLQHLLLQGVAKYADFKIYEDEGPNMTDVDASLQQLKDNDAKLKELNLNNIKVDECRRPQRMR